VQIIGVSNLTGAITARLLLRTEGSSAGWSSCPYQPSDAFFKSVDLQVKLLSILYFRLFMFSSPKHDHTAVLVNIKSIVCQPTYLQDNKRYNQAIFETVGSSSVHRKNLHPTKRVAIAHGPTSCKLTIPYIKQLYYKRQYKQCIIVCEALLADESRTVSGNTS